MIASLDYKGVLEKEKIFLVWLGLEESKQEVTKLCPFGKVENVPNVRRPLCSG